MNVWAPRRTHKALSTLEVGQGIWIIVVNPEDQSRNCSTRGLPERSQDWLVLCKALPSAQLAMFMSLDAAIACGLVVHILKHHLFRVRTVGEVSLPTEELASTSPDGMVAKCMEGMLSLQLRLAVEDAAVYAVRSLLAAG